MKTNEHAALAEARGDGLYRAVAIANGVRYNAPGYEATTLDIAQRAAQDYLRTLWWPEDVPVEGAASHCRVVDRVLQTSASGR